MQRGEIWWVTLPASEGAEPGYRHPVVIVQADSFNRSNLKTVLVAVITSNLTRAGAPGNVRLTRRSSKLPKDSVINVSQLVTVDRTRLTQRVSSLSGDKLSELNGGLRLVLSL